MTPPIIRHLRTTKVREIFARNNIEHVYLTGSFARGEEQATSDIDLIFEKKPNIRFSLFNIGDMKYHLEEELGREVDLVSETAIRPELRPYLERDKISIF